MASLLSTRFPMMKGPEIICLPGIIGPGRAELHTRQANGWPMTTNIGVRPLARKSLGWSVPDQKLHSEGIYGEGEVDFKMPNLCTY